MTPPPVLRTERLSLRRMTHDDLDDMASLLGNAETMKFYQAPKTRDEASRWIDWNLGLYEKHGFGLWIVELLGGTFIGDCGITPQDVDGETEMEIGYHLLPFAQGHGYATEAAIACREHARSIGIERLVAITVPENRPSQHVAEKMGMVFEREFGRHGRRKHLHSQNLRPVKSHSV